MSISSSLKNPFMKSCVSTLALLAFVSPAAPAQINEISEFDALAQSSLEQEVVENDRLSFKGAIRDAQAGKCVVETTWEHWRDGVLIGVGVTHGSPYDCGVSLSDPAGGYNGGAIGDSVVGVYGHHGGGGSSDDNDNNDDNEEDEEDFLCNLARSTAESLNEPLIDPGNIDPGTISGALAQNLNNLNNLVRAEYPWVQVNLGASIAYYGSLGLDLGVYAHTNGDYGISITPSGGVGIGIEAHGAFTFTSTHPAGGAIDGAFSVVGLRGGIGTAGEENFRLEVGAAVAVGGAASGQASYSFTRDCGNLND